MDGLIDDLRIYNTALTAAQVRSIYTQSGAPASNFRVMPQPNLAWDFNGTTTPYIGTATGTVVNTVSYSPGKFNQGITINNPSATSNYVSYSTTSVAVDSGYTISIWVLPNTSTTGWYGIVYDASGTTTIYLYYGGTNLQISYWDGTAYANPPSYNGVTAGKWYHVVFTIFNGTNAYYVNGSLVGTTNYTNRGYTAKNLAIGCAPGYAGGNFTMDDLRIFDRALTSAQVQSIYNQQGMPGRAVVSNDTYITSGLVAYYDTQNLRYPNSVSGTTWYDISGNGRSVTIRPGSSYNSSGKYITFDGTVNSGTTVAQSGQSLTRWTVMCAFMQTANGTSFARVAGSSPAYDAGEIALYGQALAFNPPENSAWTTTSFTTTYNVWYHMCVAFDTTTTGVVDAWVYINGALVNSYTIDGTVETLTGYTIGARNDFNNEAMIGRMSLFAIYNRVLSPSEVSANYEFYKKTQIPTYLPVQLTGAPLFNQLSQSAASSAVGAFSLRAVNGVTAKAVQVRAVPSGASSPSVFSIIGNQFSAPDQSPTPPDTSVAGQTSYNGTTQYTRIQNLALTPATTGVTIHLNFKLNTRGNTPLKLSPPYPGSIFEIDTNTSNIAISEYNITIGSWASLGNIAYTTSTNVYIAITISGVTVKTYVNNSLAFTGAFRTALPNTNYDLYGLGSWNGGGYANMNVYDFRIINTTLSESAFTPIDFYADERGNLLTAPVVGTSLQNWLGGATGYVTKWYDQSGKGNDASQNTAAAQPIIQRATKGPGYACLFNGTTNSLNLGTYALLNNTPYSVSIAERRNTSNFPMFLFGENPGASGLVANKSLHIGYVSDTSFRYGLWSTVNIDASVAAYAGSSEPLRYHTQTFSTSTYMRSYINASLRVTNTSTTQLQAVDGTYSIGYVNNYYSGEIYEVLVFTRSLYDLDGTSTINQIYQNQLGAYGT
jgi:hypothetical protein